MDTPYDAKYWRERSARNDQTILKDMQKRGKKPRSTSEVGSWAGVCGDEVAPSLQRLRRRGLVKFIKPTKCPTCGHQIIKTGGWVLCQRKRRSNRSVKSTARTARAKAR
jgi:hypothetical protein